MKKLYSLPIFIILFIFVPLVYAYDKKVYQDKDTWNGGSATHTYFNDGSQITSIHNDDGSSSWYSIDSSGNLTEKHYDAPSEDRSEDDYGGSGSSRTGVRNSAQSGGTFGASNNPPTVVMPGSEMVTVTGESVYTITCEGGTDSVKVMVLPMMEET